MKLYRYIIPVALAAVLAGCKQQEEAQDAKAVLSEETVLTFASTEAEPQTMDVYADGSWSAEVSDDWIHVDPMFGDKNTTVTVTVDDNYDAEGAIDSPRSGSVSFGAAHAYSTCSIVIKQKGDNFKGVEEMSVSSVCGLSDEAFAKIKLATVMAVADTMAVLSDDSGNILVKGATVTGLNVGDVCSMAGTKLSYLSLPIFAVEEYDVKSSGSASYPEASDITTQVETYAPSTHDYLKITGTLACSTQNDFADVHVSGSMIRPVIVLPTEEVKALNLHNVTMTGYYVGTEFSTPKFVVATVTDAGEAGSPFPARIALGTSVTKNYTTASWSALSMVEAWDGYAYLHYVPARDSKGELVKNDNGKYLLDVSGDHLRVTGAWPEDYWLFEVPTPVKAGSQVSIKFETRVSATNPKYWMLEYYDGTTWKIAGNVKTSTDTGSSLNYTHMMASDGSTNILVEETVTFNKNNDACLIRFRCLTAFQANGAATLAARNGGTARISTTDNTSQECWPTITLLKEGDGVEIPDKDPVYAEITVDNDLLTFEGEGGTQTIKVKSDHAFTVESDCDWLSFDPAEGGRGSEVEVTVTCAATELSTLRQGTIKIVSEDSVSEIKVVQSAAGQELDPLLSISKSKATAAANGSNLKIRVQSNVDYTMTPDVDWITVTPATKSMVNQDDVTIAVAKNASYDERTGRVVFAAGEQECILTVTQAGQSKYEVLFEDDFSWLSDMIAEFNAANDVPVSDFVGGSYASLAERINTPTAGKHQAPNAYTAEPFASKFPAALEAAGYTDLNPSGKVIYPQDAYLKLGKTSVHTGLQFAPFSKLKGSSADVIFNFDWAAMMTGKFAVDQVSLILKIEGEGTFGNGTKVSDAMSTTQQDNQDPFWKSEQVKIYGVNASTKITIISTQGDASLKTTGAFRYFLDNIKVEKVSETVWNDDFSWLSDMIKEFNAANEVPVSDFVGGTYESLAERINTPTAGKHQAPNAYTAEPFKTSFPAALAAAGYTDLNPSGKVIYPQDAYLKLGKTSVHTGLTFEPFQGLSGSHDGEISFDWACMITTKFAVDQTSLILKIEGDGTFDNGTKVSDVMSTTQKDNEDPFWKSEKVKVSGVSASTKITIISTQGDESLKTTGAFRYFLDNVKVSVN